MEFFSDVGGDPRKPSIFELVAQEQLRDLLQPALKYVLSVFAQRYPRHLLRLVNRHEEFYAFIMLFVENHYLRKHNASFAENFYGLKRRRKPLIEPERALEAVRGVPSHEKLRERDIRMSLAFLVAIPYIQSKAQDYFESIGGGVASDIIEESSPRHQPAQPQTFRDRFKRSFKTLYPWLNATYEGWLLLHNIAYLFNKTAFYRPWLGWMRLDIRRLNIDDYREMNALINAGSTASNKDARTTMLSRIGRIFLRSPRFLLDSLKYLLPMAIFFIKFLEWWYSPSSPARSLSTAPTGPSIPPPQILLPHPDGLAVNGREYGQCPICQQTISNATALPTGYVFCYRCIYAHVEKYGKCPVTLCPSFLYELRKVLV
ncbi:hypothetical protein SISNIDRAFT_449147 [Sistotremastrum niveocremeum HHB9708]|uniref:Peroxisome assembly protein 12 n=2 Tax=Sistotremastraceae TaxID=3402574 RepID=A0A164Z6Q1_9AGAM|nr:hypothetical protein SISNIDRAFT_449147 [Sistotremastrum niveocremeum HHB9708]KZT39629.1 hypothetical protein SISSUDRAFT_1045321 [Sistotremastrum suecicum HHB10207 ss-3]